jgi:hypothetical protein
LSTVYERLVAFGQAMYDAGIDPRTVQVLLPEGEWRALSETVAEEAKRLNVTLHLDPLDEIAHIVGQPMTVMGVSYAIRYRW